MMPDYLDDYDDPCPNCGHTPTRSRDCTDIRCDGGYINLYDEDPLWYDEDDYELCDECHGTGIQRWCPKCGEDLNKKKWRKQRENDSAE